MTGASAFSVRTHPSVNAPRAGTIPRNGTFTTDRCEVNSRREGGKSRSWCYISEGSVRGWVSVNNNFVTLIAG